jgi:hypothetical protein
MGGSSNLGGLDGLGAHAPTANGTTANSGATMHGPTTGGATNNFGGSSNGPGGMGGMGGSYEMGGLDGLGAHAPTTGGATTGGTHTTTTGGMHTTTTGGGTTGGMHTTTTGGGTTGGRHTTTTGGRPAPVNATPLNNRQNLAGRSSAPGTQSTAFHSAPAPRGSNERVTRSGNAIRTRPDGRVSDVHDTRRGMDVHHGLNGNSRISVERHDGSRLVAERGRPGFAQRGYSYHGHDFARRAYFYHGHEYTRYYRGYGYHGVFLNIYAPGFYYGPGFYGWAYYPWATPITFGWGWGGSPWYGYYGGYFAPYPVYPSAAFWLTDYLISQDLQAAYAAHQEAGEADGVQDAAGGPPELAPEVKQEIADEVRNELALENSEAQQTAQHQDVDPASSGIARLLTDGHPHVFVVGSALDVVDVNGQECGISDGDALALRTPPAQDATAADMVVLASKGGQECAKNDVVTVQLTDLQEMQNQMRATIDQGLQELQSKQGKDGLPPAPPAAQAPPAQADYAAIAPPPDPNDAADLQQQVQQANLAEKDVVAEASQDAGAPPATAVVAPSLAAAPPTVELGQTIDQVQAAMGSPLRVANLGPKVIYYYNGMKVIFKDGKVSDVQ